MGFMDSRGGRGHGRGGHVRHAGGGRRDRRAGRHAGAARLPRRAHTRSTRTTWATRLYGSSRTQGRPSQA